MADDTVSDFPRSEQPGAVIDFASARARRRVRLAAWRIPAAPETGALDIQPLTAGWFQNRPVVSLPVAYRIAPVVSGKRKRPLGWVVADPARLPFQGGGR